jgi:hypothetical protein
MVTNEVLVSRSSGGDDEDDESGLNMTETSGNTPLPKFEYYKPQGLKQ